MSLMEKSPKDNSRINLIILTGAKDSLSRPKSLSDFYAKVDVTDQVKEALGDNSFTSNSVLGIQWEDGFHSNTQTLYYSHELKEKLSWAMGRLLDAAIVNEKQKKALRELMDSAIYDVFDSKTDTVELALQTLN